MHRQTIQNDVVKSTSRNPENFPQKRNTKLLFIILRKSQGPTYSQSKSSDPSCLRHPTNGTGLLWNERPEFRQSQRWDWRFQRISATLQLTPGTRVGVRAPGLVQQDRSRSSNRPPQVVTWVRRRGGGNVAPNVVERLRTVAPSAREVAGIVIKLRCQTVTEVLH